MVVGGEMLARLWFAQFYHSHNSKNVAFYILFLSAVTRESNSVNHCLTLNSMLHLNSTIHTRAAQERFVHNVENDHSSKETSAW